MKRRTAIADCSHPPRCSAKPVATDRAASAFTLVELLVVITIVALLVALLLPSLKQAREAARAAVCASRLHGLAVAIETYRTEWQEWYPTRGCIYPDGTTSHFIPLMMPYLNLPLESTHYKKLADENFMLCPSSEYTPPPTGLSNSQMRVHIREKAYLLGWDHVGNYNMTAHFGHHILEDMEARYQPRKYVATPPARTIMTGEAFHTARLGYPFNAVNKFTFYHTGRTNILFVDGHVAPYTDPLSDHLGDIVFY